MVKQTLPEKVWRTVFFGFSDEALLEILDREMDIDLDQNVLIYRKALLDARSIRIAQATSTQFTTTQENDVQSLCEWLFKATRCLYREDLGHQRTLDVQDEYAEYFKLFAQNYGEMAGAEWLQQLKREATSESRPLWRRFMNYIAADGVFKTDAAHALFGEESGYTQAWMRKTYFRYRIANQVGRFQAGVPA